ncbi:MAG: DUF192 domain-containing protein [Patescibacteria group bacterium]
MSNKIFFILFLGGCIAVIVHIFYFRNVELPREMTMQIEGKAYKLLTATTSEEWRVGLMNRERLENADGMIFIFPTKQPRTFWNYNTHLNLDVYWMDGNNVVGKSRLPSIDETKNPKIVQSPKPVDRVVELVR